MRAVTGSCFSGSRVLALLAEANSLHVGGRFTSIGGLDHACLARFRVPVTLDAPTELADRELAWVSAPNPARAAADVRFTLPARGVVSLAVCDPAGRRVATLVDHEVMLAGPHHVPLTAASLKTGPYFARLEVDERRSARKLMVLH